MLDFIATYWIQPLLWGLLLLAIWAGVCLFLQSNKARETAFENRRLTDDEQEHRAFEAVFQVVWMLVKAGQAWNTARVTVPIHSQQYEICVTVKRLDEAAAVLNGSTDRQPTMTVVP